MVIQFMKKYWKPILGLAIVLALVVYAYVLGNRLKETENKYQQATAVTADQATNINYLQNSLNESKQNAEMLAQAVKQVQAGQVQPVTHFYIQSTSTQAAADTVAKRINDKDQTLPPAALEPSDRNIVVPNPNKTPQANYDIGVFKVNNYRNWEWSAGYGQHGGDRYIPVELQRNFSKNAAVSVEYHIGGRESGYELKYTRKTDKLFFLF